MHRSPVIQIIGKRSTGKTVMAKHLANTLASTDTVVVDPVHELHGIYASIPAEYTFTDLSGDALLSWIKARQELEGTSTLTVIVDDSETIYRNYKAKSPKPDLFTQVLFKENRFRRISVILADQYAVRQPIQRANIDYVFIMREEITANRRRLFEQYGGAFPSLAVFSQILDQATREPFECLVLDLANHSTVLEEKVFWYRAPAPAPAE